MISNTIGLVEYVIYIYIIHICQHFIKICHHISFEEKLFLKKKSNMSLIYFDITMTGRREKKKVSSDQDIQGIGMGMANMKTL